MQTKSRPVTKGRENEPVELTISKTFMQIKGNWKPHWDKYNKNQARLQKQLETSDDDLALHEYITDCPFEDLLSISYQVSNMNFPNMHANFQSSMGDNHDLFVTSTPKASPRKNKP